MSITNRKWEEEIHSVLAMHSHYTLSVQHRSGFDMCLKWDATSCFDMVAKGIQWRRPGTLNRSAEPYLWERWNEMKRGKKAFAGTWIGDRRISQSLFSFIWPTTPLRKQKSQAFLSMSFYSNLCNCIKTRDLSYLIIPTLWPLSDRNHFTSSESQCRSSEGSCVSKHKCKVKTVSLTMCEAPWK